MIKLLIIHPKWLIEENANNFRNEVWFKPPIEPINVEIIIVALNRKKFKQNDKIIRGAIFCHVIKIKLLIHDKPSITLGSQKWNGATPLFIIKIEARHIFKIIFFFVNKFNSENIKIMIINKSVLEAIAWVKKYFNEASEENKLLDFIERGIKDNKLISKPIQTLNQDEELILISVPIINVNKNKSL